MWQFPHRCGAVTLLCTTGFLLAACGSSERDDIADRMERDIAAGHITNPEERREVAESLADDVIALREEARQVAEAEAAAARTIEAQVGTVEDAMSRDCAMLRLELAALQRPSTEIRTPEEIAAIPQSIEGIKLRLQQNCQGR